MHTPPVTFMFAEMLQHKNYFFIKLYQKKSAND